MASVCAVRARGSGFETQQSNSKKQRRPPAADGESGSAAAVVAAVAAAVAAAAVAAAVRMSDCCLQGIKPCERKGKGYQLVGNRVFRLGSIKELRKE